MFKKLKRQFFAGLVIFVPLCLTIYFFWLFFLLVSQALIPLLHYQRWIEVHAALVRPLSFTLTVLFIWILGLIASNYFGKQFVGILERTIHHIPIFRGFYEAIQKVTEAFFGANPLYQSVVLVEYPRKGSYTFGFVTQRLPGKIFNSEEMFVCVFIPTVPNPTSGLLLYVPEREALPLDISIEDAAKILVSHGFVPIQESAIRRKE